MDTNHSELLAKVEKWDQLGADERKAVVRQAAEWTASGPDAWRRLWTAASELVDRAILDKKTTYDVVDLVAVMDRVSTALLRSGVAREARALSPVELTVLKKLYPLLNGAGADPAKGQILRMLTADGHRDSLALFAELLVADPPYDPREATLAVSPLFQRRGFAVDALFPRLLDCLARPETAALAIDLANYVTRRGIVDEHPAADRAVELADLLAGVTHRLVRIEENPHQFASDPTELRHTVETGIALAIALCDALALIGNADVTSKLHQVLIVGHRRLRTEAAAALARLGDPRGAEVLAELAADPAARTRALAYLEEVGELEKAKAIDRSDSARAAAQLADWLAEPSQFGAPPHEVQLIDTRRQYWPGFGEPIDCRLFVYEYRLRDGEFSAVGIVGPVTYSLTADLEDLAPDDIYAAFAGWQAEHDDLRETPADQTPADQLTMLMAHAQELAGDRYTNIEPIFVGEFFGERILVATARQGAATGTLIVDADHAQWYPAGANRRPIGPAEAYYIHKGRKLLKIFNPDGPLSVIDDVAD